MEKLSGRIVEMEVMPDHVHILLDCSPQFFIPDAIKHPSYCAVTVSDRSIGQVQEYIRIQKTK